MDLLLPVASITTSASWPRVMAVSAASSEPSPRAVIVCGTPMRSRQNARRASFMSITMQVAPATFTNSSALRPMGPAPMMSTCSPAFTLARSTAWQPMASVSTRASCS